MKQFLRPVGRVVHWLLTAKCLLAMRLTIILLTAAVLQVSAKGYTQNVTISLKNASLDKVFSEIKKQTGYTFMYTETMLREAKKVNIDVKNTSLEQTLKICFAEQPFTYEIIEKTIIVKPRETTSPNESTTEKENPPPPIDISGKVTDADGNPLEGATVAVKGMKNITKTDASGVFLLKAVNEDGILEISYAEHETTTLKVGGKTSLMITLNRAETTMGEVILNKGYYTEKQKFSTGNVSTISARDIERQPVNNPLLAIAGRVPGIFITQSSGVPGSGVTTLIQGQNSIASGNDPFYVIDGVPFAQQLLPNRGTMLGRSGVNNTQTGNPLAFINPSDRGYFNS